MFSTSLSSRIQYTPLDGENSKLRQRVFKYLTSMMQFWREAVIICLVIVCAILTTKPVISPLSVPKGRENLQDYQLSSHDTRWRQFKWNTDMYSSKESSALDAINTAWDQIVPAFGIVAVDHKWAADHNLPASMHLPSDASKGVYIIDAYHQLHCLTIIRKTLVELESGQIPSKPIEHSRHCFDSLLQYIVCGTSGDTLLYTWGRNETGSGQLRKCIDWNSRKDWVRKNTACYKDGDHPIPLYDHFDHCETTDDGIHLYSNL